MSKLRHRDSLAKKYSFEPYSSIYPNLFSNEKERLITELESFNPIIEHFGSTSIANVGGKGIIDIFILVDKAKITEVSELLTSRLGYEFRASGGDAERLFHQIEISERRYHVHLSHFGSESYKESIRFRDFLRNNSLINFQEEDCRQMNYTCNCRKG